MAYLNKERLILVVAEKKCDRNLRTDTQRDGYTGENSITPSLWSSKSFEYNKVKRYYDLQSY